MTITATYVKRIKGWTGSASLWRLSGKVVYGDGGETTGYVIVSSTVAYSGPETYIFPSDKDGEVLSWLEMDGSYRGGLDKTAAISAAGWTAVV